MSNTVQIPSDRTQKQPARAYCRNPECLEASNQRWFEFTPEHAHVACPKCGATEAPMIGMLSLVHFLHRNPKGPIVGVGGLRFQLACSEGRAHLATITNDEAATDQLGPVNCPGCLKAIAEKKLADKQGRVITTATLALTG